MEKGITFSILKVLIEVIPFNSSTREKRVFLKVMSGFKKRISSELLAMYDGVLYGTILNR